MGLISFPLWKNEPRLLFFFPLLWYDVCNPAFYSRCFVHNKHFPTHVLILVLQILTFLFCGKQVGPVAHEQPVWREKIFMSCFLLEKGMEMEEKNIPWRAVMAEVGNTCK